MIVGAHRGWKGLLARANLKRKLLSLNICNCNCTFCFARSGRWLISLPLRLFEFIHHPLRPPKILQFLLAMESPELPAAFGSAERFNDLLTSRVLLQKVRAVICNVINDNKQSSILNRRPLLYFFWLDEG